MEADVRRPGELSAAEGSLFRGTNQSGMRDSNERLVLSLVRRHGGLAKSDIARMTGLSAQTVSVIMRSLEEDGLLLRLAPVRGRIGQPSVPMALNPEGAFFFGLKLGRRSTELVLLDFGGRVRGMLQNRYSYPTPSETVAFVAEGVKRLRAELGRDQDRRIAGLGVAMPFELWSWAESTGAPPDVLEQWRNRDIRADIGACQPFPVSLQNDATAACGAELVFGDTGGFSDFVYFYIGAFAGGGVVLNGSLFTGRTGNAGALGSMPVPTAEGPRQLIDIASIALLERMLRAEGQETDRLWVSPEDWGELGPPLEAWLEAAGDALAYAIVSASALIDFQAAVIEGWMPASVRARLAEAVRRSLTKVDAEGIAVPTVREGTVGIHARALGGASLPLAERFLLGSGIAAARAA